MSASARFAVAASHVNPRTDHRGLWIEPLSVGACYKPSVVVRHIESENGRRTINLVLASNDKSQVCAIRPNEAERKEELQAATVKLRDCSLVVTSHPAFCRSDRRVEGTPQREFVPLEFCGEPLLVVADDVVNIDYKLDSRIVEKFARVGEVVGDFGSLREKRKRAIALFRELLQDPRRCPRPSLSLFFANTAKMAS